VIEPAATGRRDERAENRPRAVLGVIVAPGLAHDVTSRIASELLQDLRARYDSVDLAGPVAIVVGAEGAGHAPAHP